MDSSNMRVLWLCLYFFITVSNADPKLRCFYNSMDDYVEVSLDAATTLLDEKCMSNNKTLFYTFGYQGRPTGRAVTAVMNGFLKYTRYNVILLNWEEEASTAGLGISLGYALNAIPNSKRVGNEFGDALVAMFKKGLRRSSVYLMGHSVGAHLLGIAGRVARAKGYPLPRITGLDPARALYESSAISIFLEKLDQDCADYVDLVHTDPGEYGVANEYGTVNIWPNYGQNQQPACPQGNFEQFSEEDLCSHDRSWRLVVDSLQYFLSLKAGGGEDERQTTYIGLNANLNARGNFYLLTNGISPYGQSESGIRTGPDDL